MQDCANVQTVQCFCFHQCKNPEVKDPTSLQGLSVQPEPWRVPAAYDPSTKIVSLIVNVTQLFHQNRGLALARRAAHGPSSLTENERARITLQCTCKPPPPKHL